MSQRTPPANADVESALLGAMLLGADAVELGLEACTAADLVGPQHASIFRAIASAYAAGGAVDPVTVAEELRRREGLDAVGGRKRLEALRAGTPASANARQYARIVADLALLRRLLAAAGETAELVYDEGRAQRGMLGMERPDASQILGRARELVDGCERPSAGADDSLAMLELDELLHLPAPLVKPWVVPPLLRVGDVLVLTGGEGAGKMTLFRQLAIGAAAGIHPFTDQPMRRQRVLIVDLQEDATDVRDALAPLRRHVGAHYREGAVKIVCRKQGINLLARRDARAFEGLLARVEPDLVVMGPIKKTYRPPPGKGLWDDDVVEELQARLDEWIVRYGFALCLEGHAGHDRETWRMKGSSAWYAWPAFGYGLNPESWRPREMQLVRWRGDRYDGRPWPFRITENREGGWPWLANPDAVASMRSIAAMGDPVDQASLKFASDSAEAL